MEKIEQSPFSSLSIPKDCEVSLKDNILHITKWNWDFKDCEAFQNEALKIVRKNKSYKVYIFCNHPHCFTMGRGNERGEDDLIEFDPAIESELNFPLHKIHRGGGITFHYPGQWIFYPICSIGDQYTLDDHMCWILKSTTKVLKENFDLADALTAKKLMGIWTDKQKIASIGVGLKRFVSLHGLALNLVHDKEMFDALEKINPCGLNSEVYICLDQKKPRYIENLVQNFHQSYIKSIT